MKLQIETHLGFTFGCQSATSAALCGLALQGYISKSVFAGQIHLEDPWQDLTKKHFVNCTLNYPLREASWELLAIIRSKMVDFAQVVLFGKPPRSSWPGSGRKWPILPLKVVSGKPPGSSWPGSGETLNPQLYCIKGRLQHRETRF